MMMGDSRKNTFETLEDSALIEMALGANVVDKESAYEDMLIEKLSLEKIKNEIDRTTGAPSNVRFSVGAAQSPEDKLATLQVFPEFTQLGGKYSLGLEKKIEVFKSIEEGGNLGWYAKAAIEAELGIGERRRVAFGREPESVIGSFANTSAAIGLSSPLSGVKNYAIQIPKGFGNWGVMNTVSAMAKAGWHPWRRGTKSQRDLYYEGIEKGYVGYGTPEMMATESTTAIRWWFDKVNQMNRTENFNLFHNRNHHFYGVYGVFNTCNLQF